MVSNNRDQKHKAYRAKSEKWPEKRINVKNRSRKSQRLSNLMPKLLGPVMQARGLTISRIITDWPHLAGDAKDWSEPQSLKFPPGKTAEGSLTVNVASGRGPEMQMMTGEIISRTNQLFGYRAVSRIVISQTAMHAKKQVKPQNFTREWSAAEKSAFQKTQKAAAINASPELQKALDNLGKSLAED